MSNEAKPDDILAAARTLIDWVLDHPSELRGSSAMLEELRSAQRWALDHGADSD